MWKLDDAMRFRKSRNVATYFKGVGEGMIKMMLSDVEKIPPYQQHSLHFLIGDPYHMYIHIYICI